MNLILASWDSVDLAAPVRPACHPAILFKMLIYGYLRPIYPGKGKTLYPYYLYGLGSGLYILAYR